MSLGIAFVSRSTANARPSWPKPRTLLEVRSLDAFAQDGNRIAWVDSSQPCRRLVQLRDLATRVTTPLLRRTAVTCELRNSAFGFERRMALAGSRALWAYLTTPNNEVEIFTAAPGSRERQIDLFDVSRKITSPHVAMAGDGRTLVYAAYDGQHTGVFRVRPGADFVAATELPTAVAASGNRFAVARYRPAGCICNDSASWSPDGTKLAFRGARGAGFEVGELYVIDADGRNLRRLVSGRQLGVIGWGAAGKSIFYLDRSGVFSVDLNRRRRRLLGLGLGQVGGLVLSPDRRFLFYYTTANELRVLATSTGERRTLAKEKDGVDWLGWSPDGRAIAYTTSAGAEKLRFVSASGGTPRTLATIASAHPRAEWTPNSQEIAFERPEGISVVTTDSGPERQVVAGAARLGGWSPDGASLAYWRLGGSNVSGLYVSAADGTNERRVAGPGFDATWSPDSTELAFDAGAGGAIHVATASGGDEHQLVEGFYPGWSPNGKRLVYEVPANPREYSLGGEIAVVNRDGSDVQKLTRTKPEPDLWAIETRAWEKGSVLASFATSGRVEALALDGNRVALLRGNRAHKRIEIRRTNGPIVRVVAVPKRVDSELAMAGRWVVFCVGRAIRVVDVRSGSASVLAVADGRVIGLSIEGRRVAWGEQRRGLDRIRAIVMPR